MMEGNKSVVPMTARMANFLLVPVLVLSGCCCGEASSGGGASLQYRALMLRVMKCPGHHMLWF